MHAYIVELRGKGSGVNIYFYTILLKDTILGNKTLYMPMCVTLYAKILYHDPIQFPTTFNDYYNTYIPSFKFPPRVSTPKHLPLPSNKIYL